MTILSTISPWAISGIVIAAVVVLVIIIWFVVTLNTFARLKVKINESESGIDVALTKRYDTLTKSMQVAKSFAKHEKGVLKEVIALRKGMSIDEKSQVSRSMDEAQKGLNILAEAYPTLLSSENYKALQAAIADAEEHLQAARRAYNSNVSLFNQKLVSFPSSLVGKMKNYKHIGFFAADAHKKQDVAIDLD